MLKKFLALSMLKTVALLNIFVETVISFSKFFDEKNVYILIYRNLCNTVNVCKVSFDQCNPSF